MKRINGKELLIAYLIRAAIVVVLYIYIKMRGLLDVNTVGIFAAQVMAAIYQLVPSIASFFVNRFYMRKKKYGGTYNVTVFLIDYFVSGGLFAILGFLEGVREMMTYTDYSGVGGFVLFFLPAILMMMAVPFSLALFIILLFFGKSERF